MSQCAFQLRAQDLRVSPARDRRGSGLVEGLDRHLELVADLFERGEYLPLHASGTFADCCVSFVRQLDDDWMAVFAPRLSSKIGFPPIGEAWQDTAVQLPETFSLKEAHDLFTCQPIRHQKRQIPMRDVLSVLPFMVITNLR